MVKLSLSLSQKWEKVKRARFQVKWCSQSLSALWVLRLWSQANLRRPLMWLSLLLNLEMY
jgi:hypothetical protein